MPAVAGRVVHAVDKGLGTVLGPDRGVVEFPRVPHHLVHDLRDFYGVCGRARAGHLETAARGVCYVALVVWAVEVLAVPATRDIGISCWLLTYLRAEEKDIGVCKERAYGGLVLTSGK